MANTYKALSTVTVGAGGASTVSFTNIPQTYTDLQVVFSFRSVSGASSGVGLYFNNTTGNWAQVYMIGDGVNASSGTNAYNLNPTYGWVGYSNSSVTTANTYSNTTFYIPNYTGNANTKVVSVDSVYENNATLAVQDINALLWSATNPITQITLLLANGNIEQYSTATLYGVFNADVSSAPATPTIGTATASGLGANVTFTGVSNAASYIMTSSPSSITATGTTSPIYVSGLADNTSYTFTVQAQNPFGLSSASAASNSITTTTAGWENLGSYTGTTPSVTFSSIPSTYQHLAILYNIRTDQVGGGANEPVWIRVNSVAGTNYGELVITSTPANGVNSSQGVNQDSWGAFATPGATTSTNTFGVGVIYIYNYADSNIKKAYSTHNGYYDESAAYYYQNYAQGAVNLTSAINEVKIQSGNYRTWATGTRISLYGIRGS